MKLNWKHKGRAKKKIGKKKQKRKMEQTVRKAYLQKIQKRLFKKCKWFATLFALKVMKQTKI